MKTKIITMVITGFLILSCNTDSSVKIFDVAVLNTNIINWSSRLKFFDELIELKEKNLAYVADENSKIKKGTIEEYVTQKVINPINENLNKLEALNKTDENKDLIEASVKLHQFSKNIFENDFLEITKMIDELPSGELSVEILEPIYLAIEKFYYTHITEMETLMVNLEELAIPYAEKHNIPFETKTMGPK